jgi:hypothetical protein
LSLFGALEGGTDDQVGIGRECHAFRNVTLLHVMFSDFDLVKFSIPFGGTTMNSDSADSDRTPHAAADQTGRPGKRMLWYTCDDGGEGVTTYTYEIGEEPWQFTFTHDAAKGVYVLAKADGTIERFRDNPARHLVVERDPVTGELRPAVKRGQPTYIYLCREQREP